MTRHLVAGAGGFLGSHLVDRLLAQGDEVVGVDNFTTGTPANLDSALRSGAFTLLRHDVTRPLELSSRIDRVWNLASPASPPDYMRRPIATMKTGALGTHNLLGLAKRHRARFLLASTSEVYGDPDVTPQRESYWGNVNPVGPRAVYDEAKRFAEAMTRAYEKTHGLEARIVRIFNTYGPRMRLDDGRVVPNFIGQTLRGEPLTIYGDGSQTRSFCFVDDEVEGLLAAMEADDPGPINIGNPDEITILEFAAALERVVGRPLAREFRPLPRDDPRRRRPDISKAKSVLGWEPRVDLRTGLARTFEHYRSRAPPEPGLAGA